MVFWPETLLLCSGLFMVYYQLVAKVFWDCKTIASIYPRIIRTLKRKRYLLYIFLLQLWYCGYSNFFLFFNVKKWTIFEHINCACRWKICKMLPKCTAKSNLCCTYIYIGLKEIYNIGHAWQCITFQVSFSSLFMVWIFKIYSQKKKKV